jgi:hypothetical protein
MKTARESGGLRSDVRGQALYERLSLLASELSVIG